MTIKQFISVLAFFSISFILLFTYHSYSKPSDPEYYCQEIKNIKEILDSIDISIANQQKIITAQVQDSENNTKNFKFLETINYKFNRILFTISELNNEIVKEDHISIDFNNLNDCRKFIFTIKYILNLYLNNSIKLAKNKVISLSLFKHNCNCIRSCLQEFRDTLIVFNDKQN